MHVSATTDAPPATNADTIVVGVFEDEGIAHDHGGVLQALVDSGEAKRGLRKLAVTHAEGKRYIVAGLGARYAFDPERARIAAAGVVARAQGARGQDALLGGPAPRLRRARRRARRGHAAGGLQRTASSRAQTTTIRRPRRAAALRPPRRERARRPGRDGGRRRQPRPRPPEPPGRTCSRRPRWPSTPQALEGVVGRGHGRRRRSRPRAWAPSPASRRAPTRTRG